ncbi:Hypothetical protein MIP_07443 [Mycobacterium intracellulare subsp. intracellulare MTCC 9506]|uniref:Uncharacterized protein n=1 Tax=Mycobacterium indicus pranii (strain DSM 45239 / MTCC 9506) TaxID=1232724 RepID=J9WNM3_MYCIP|nr:Hypothetical protein MIP_07443 [Mycobacterium intracellulare subsp. intracellulare MTCC 9506]
MVDHATQGDHSHGPGPPHPHLQHDCLLILGHIFWHFGRIVGRRRWLRQWRRRGANHAPNRRRPRG